ncbi:MAG: hypothetical protein NC938_05635 [Candidatus Omnitrophica bacterium]|nr:hypothetical protein [Candidatus Omnitrophota bacterium]MCM8791159.1 hypothetical protein [Candidatus Omnitrophota bacterium]
MNNIDPLLMLIVVPIAAGFLCLGITDRLRAVPKVVAFAITLASFAASLFVFMHKPSLSQYGSSVILLADNLSAFIALAVTFFALLITVYSFSYIDKSFGRYFGYLLMTLGSSIGVLFANDLVIMLVFWGMLAALLYLMVAMDGTPKAAAAAKKAIIIIGGTDAIMIFGIGIIWALTGTFAMDKVHLQLAGAFSYAAYFSLVIASFAKAGAMPFHSWLPDVAEDGPASVTAYLPASVDKLLGIYLLARISLDLFVANHITNAVLIIVGAVTIVLAVVIALIQHDLKRLLGYHAVSQVGYMVLGIGTGNPTGIAGGLFHMLNHAIYKSCLFLSAGSVEKKALTQDLDNLGGLAKYMPITFISFLVASLSISGIPPFNGFVSKWMIYQGIIESSASKDYLWVVWLVAAMFGSALTIASFMKLLHAVFLGRPSENLKNVREASFSMILPICVLAAACFIFGILAFKIALPLFIMPATALSPSYLGTWNPTLATSIMAVGVLIGLLVYAVMAPKRLRTVESFIGGEDARALPRISGADFYNTIKEIPLLKGIYAREEKGAMDVYNLGRKPVYALADFLKFLHNGVLPTYLVWCLLGMVGMFLFLFLR